MKFGLAAIWALKRDIIDLNISARPDMLDISIKGQPSLLYFIK